MRTKSNQRWRGQLLWGAVVITGGVLLLLDQLDLVDVEPWRWWTWWMWWPALMALSGAVQLIPPTTPKDMLSGLWLISFAAWWTVSYEELWGLSFSNSWPILIIVAGAGLVLQPLFNRLANAGHKGNLNEQQ